MWALTVTAIILVLVLFAAWESRARLIWWLEVGVNILTGVPKHETPRRLVVSLVFHFAAVICNTRQHWLCSAGDLTAHCSPFLVSAVKKLAASFFVYDSFKKARMSTNRMAPAMLVEGQKQGAWLHMSPSMQDGLESLWPWKLPTGI